MGKPFWDQGYSGQTLEQLLSLEEKYEDWSLLFPLELAIQAKAEKVGLIGLSDAELTVLAIEALEREVNNGGYSQFFLNSSREFAPILVDSLVRIGCPRTGDLSKRAIEALEPASFSVEDINRAVDAYCEKERQHWVPQARGAVFMRKPSDPHESAHDKMWDVLNQCDEEFFKTPENIGGKLFAFVKQNRDRIEF